MTYQAGETSAENVIDLRRYSVEENRRISDGMTTLEEVIVPGVCSVISGLKLLLRYSNITTDADPGAGMFRFDSGNFNNVSQIYVSKVSPLGGDLSPLFQYIGEDDEAYFFNQTRTNTLVYRTNGMQIDAGTYVKIPLIPSPLIAGNTNNNDLFELSFYGTRI